MHEDIKARYGGNRVKQKKISFKAAPYAEQIFTKDGRSEFNKLTPTQRQFVSQLVEHGDIRKAAVESNIAIDVNKSIDLRLQKERNIRTALMNGGLDANRMVQELSTCLSGKQMVLDKHGKLIETFDIRIKLKAIETICKLMGWFDSQDPSQGDDKKDVEELFGTVEVDSDEYKDTGNHKEGEK